LMDRLGLKEGEVIQHSMITRSIERAQKKVEENNFGIRKRLLEYDDVMNMQRTQIYTKRRHALFGDRIQIDIADMMYDVCESLVNQMHGYVDFEEFKLEVLRTLSIEPDFDENDYMKLDSHELAERLYRVIRETYRRKQEQISRQAYPVIKDVFEKQGKVYENIVVPITDGIKTYNILTNLEKSYQSEGDALVRTYEKTISLYIIDEAWKENLRELDDLKQAVQSATYEQKDPLLIYKLESFEIFKDMLDRINKEVVGILMKGHIPVRDPSQIQRGQAPKRLDLSKLETSKSEYGSSFKGGEEGQDKKDQRVQPVRVEKKVGRNDPCPCGSGKKYKQCHGRPGIGAQV